MNNIDNNINDLFTDIESKELNTVFDHIKNKFLMESIQNQFGLTSYLEKYPYWGKLSFGENNYESFMNRAKSLKEHLDDYKWLYNKLEDYRSKLVLYAVLNNWYNFDYKSLDRCIEKNYKQYWDLDLVKCDKNEVIVDLGAYFGDTVNSYISEYGKDNYKKMYCYEISKDIFEQLKNNTKNYKNIICINKAASNKEGYLYINTNDNSSSANSISTEGEDKIEAVAIDDDITEKVTLIKMDIEGAEKDAIEGCKNHIVNDTPKLLLSVYHNHEDLYAIPRMINKLNKNYKYYLRYHGGSLFTSEIILICIPK